MWVLSQHGFSMGPVATGHSLVTLESFLCVPIPGDLETSCLCCCSSARPVGSSLARSPCSAQLCPTLALPALGQVAGSSVLSSGNTVRILPCTLLLATKASAPLQSPFSLL